jgi:anthranilate synthase/aminodeoxychorismate synthase-like glutamine amidotransferase
VILFIDNYDSFIYNLVQYVGRREKKLQVVRPDQITVDEVAYLNPQKIIISPGPGHPNEAQLSLQIISRFHTEVPILGVCLGHQCIAEAFGATVRAADRLVHGKTSEIYHRGKGVLTGLSNPFKATRYHSLVVSEETVPKELEIVAYTSEGEVMGLMHRTSPLFGVQFHPESILTIEGIKIIDNFLDLQIW